MNDDELMSRLQRIDPSSGVPVHPVDGPDAAALLEQIMNEPITPAAPAKNPYTPRRKAWWGFGVAAAALVAVGATVVVLDNNSSTQDSQSVQATSTTVALSDVPVGPIGSSCIRLEGFQPPAGTVAFQGTVESVDAGTVTLTVSHWYTAGTDTQVVLNVPDASQPSPAMEGAVNFTVGDEFLVATTDGQVFGCGVSGPVSPELTALYQQWFPA